jgi:hypothetical protein
LVLLEITCEPLEGSTMLWTISVVLILLWLLGFVSSYTIGGYIHLLLVIAIIVVLLRIIQGRRAIV